jgi:putative cyclase
MGRTSRPERPSATSTGGVDRHLRGTDDVLIMPLQSGTQWDALAHIFFEGKMYNGFAADQVSSKGALKNDVAGGCDWMIGRGVLLDVPAARADWLLPSCRTATATANISGPTVQVPAPHLAVASPGPRAVERAEVLAAFRCCAGFMAACPAADLDPSGARMTTDPLSLWPRHARMRGNWAIDDKCDGCHT